MIRVFAFLVLVASLSLPVCAAETNEPASLASSALMVPSSPILTIKRNVEEVRVTFHAFDKQMRPVSDLAPESLAVYEDGSRVSAISGIQAETDLPVSVALMIDTSDSVARDFATEREAGTAFVRDLMRSRDDRVMLVAFREKIDLVQPMTGDPDELAASMRKIRIGGLTALYDALVSTTYRLSSVDAAAVRRAIIIISDGDDTDSHNLLSDAIAAAVRADVAVYTISIPHKRLNEKGSDVLNTIAVATGGRAYSLRHAAELSVAMREIERDLRSQYFVTYRPSANRTGFHSVKLLSTSKDVVIRSRAGYFTFPRD